MDFQFPNAIRFNGAYRDLNVDQPQTIGIGLANRSLMGGDLLIAADVYYKLWDDAALWQDVFVNQWAFAIGAQLTRGQCKYRLGYAYNSSPINHSVGGNLDGNQVGQDIVQLFQAGMRAVRQPAPHHLRRRARGLLGAEPRLGHFCRIPSQAIEPVRRQYGGLAGHVLPGHGFDLALRRLLRSRRRLPGERDGQLVLLRKIAEHHGDAENTEKDTAEPQMDTDRFINARIQIPPPLHPCLSVFIRS